jgi:uncharacterized membrane protein SirB2
MNMQVLLHAGLALHLIGLTSAAGTTIATYIITLQFRIQYAKDKQKGFAIIQATSKLPIVAGIGMLLLIISGVMMMAATNGFYGQQLWFRIKMVLVVVIIGSSIFLTRKLGKRLGEWVPDDMIHENRTGQIESLAGRVAYTQLFLLSLFIIIFVLSAFRFN